MDKHNDKLSGWGTVDSDIRVGLDISDKRCAWSATDLATGEVREGWLETTPEGIEEAFAGAGRCTVVLEAGTHSRWIAGQLNRGCHRGVVMPSGILRQGQGRRRRRNDRKDARDLMGLALDVDRPRSPRGLWQRPEEYQKDVALMRARDALVRARALLANAVRGTVKQFGERLEKHSVDSLPRFAREELSEELLTIVEPLLKQIEEMTEGLKEYKVEVKAYLKRRPESARLLQVDGVGPVTVGVFMAVIGEPARFARSRDVPAYFGIVPGEDQSGDADPQLGISKAGNKLARRTLLQCAHYIMSERAEDSALRRWALNLAGDGTNKVRKKKAVVALARRLAVLLHSLWVHQEDYDPLRGYRVDSEQEAEAA